MNCCRQVRDNWEMVRRIYRRTGARDDFPIRVPAKLRDRSQATRSIQSSPELLLWLAENFAETVGEFPFKVKVSDDSGEGDTEEVEFPNISEALAELCLLGLQQQHNAFVSNEIGLKLAVELLNLKVITLVTQGHAKAHSAMLGIKGGLEEKTVPCQFNFGASRLNEVLEGTEHKFDYYTAAGEDDSDGETVLGLLEQIRAVATVSAEANSTRLDDLQEAMENIDNLRNGGTAQERWRFLAALLDEGLIGTRRGNQGPSYQEIDLE
ncbi:hypothetical protein [Sodalinema gerasimenkoae]|uniref:hypothetical protein n=1 Tax=Sodalinema gerasimenkoae TaxID=2862348 RepID=UPI001359FAE4|nr:hypothetical protein [Sodalinema gerasimenkoae]